MVRRLVIAGATACFFIASPTLRADDPVPPAAFSAEVDPQTIPRRPDPAIIDDAELRLITPLLFTDKAADDTRLFYDGWIAQSYNHNPYQPPRNSNGPVAFIDRGNEYRINQWYHRVGRVIDPTLERYDFGGQVDFLYGSDAEFLQAFGLDQKIVLDNQFYRMAIPQAYVSAFAPIANGLTLKVGKFYTPFGLESPTAIGSFFPTKPYSLVYAAPLTLTGATASMSFAEQWTVTGGVVRGWNQWNDANNGLSGLISVSWRSCCRRTRITLSGLGGPEQDEPHSDFTGVTVAPGDQAMRWLVCGTLEQQLSQKWKYSLEADWGMQENAGAVGDAHWYGLMNVLQYQFDDCYSFGLRGEWFRDDDGFRVNPLRASQPIQVWSGTPADYFSVSFGAQIRANAWVTLRPELRCDWQRCDDASLPGAFDGGAKSQQALAVLDVVIRY